MFAFGIFFAIALAALPRRITPSPAAVPRRRAARNGGTPSLQQTEERFELAFSSYGATLWLPDIDAWARGVARVLAPGGRFVYVEFHPMRACIDNDLRVTGGDYFATQPFREPVGDYVALSGEGLGAGPGAVAGENPLLAMGYQHSLARIVDALAQAGLLLETLREYPYSNGCRLHPALIIK